MTRVIRIYELICFIFMKTIHKSIKLTLKSQTQNNSLLIETNSISFWFDAFQMKMQKAFQSRYQSNSIQSNLFNQIVKRKLYNCFPVRIIQLFILNLQLIIKTDKNLRKYFSINNVCRQVVIKYTSI